MKRQKVKVVNIFLVAVVAIAIVAIGLFCFLPNSNVNKFEKTGSVMAQADSMLPDTASHLDYMGRVKTGYKPATGSKAISNGTDLKNFLKGSGSGHLTQNITFNWDAEWGSYPNCAIFAPDGLELGAGRILDGCGYKITFNESSNVTYLNDDQGKLTGKGAVVPRAELPVKVGNNQDSRVYGSLVHVLRGTIKNLVFEYNRPDGNYFKVADRNSSDSSGYQVYRGAFVGFAASTGIINNVRVQLVGAAGTGNTSRFGVHRASRDGNTDCSNGGDTSFAYVGGAVGASIGNVANLQVTIDKYELEAFAYGDGWNGGGRNAEAFVGGVFGRVRAGQVRNIILEANGGALLHGADQVDNQLGGGAKHYSAAGGIVGYCDGTSINNVIFKGAGINCTLGSESDRGFVIGHSSGNTQSANNVYSVNNVTIFGQPATNESKKITTNGDINVFFDKESSGKFMVVAGNGKIVYDALGEKVWSQASSQVSVAIPDKASDQTVMDGTKKRGTAYFYDGSRQITAQNAVEQYMGREFVVKIDVEGQGVDSREFNALANGNRLNYTGQEITLSSPTKVAYNNDSSRTIITSEDLNVSRTLVITQREITCNYSGDNIWNGNPTIRFSGLVADDTVIFAGAPLAGNYYIVPRVGFYSFLVPDNGNYKFQDGSIQHDVSFDVKTINLVTNIPEDLIWNKGYTFLFDGLSNNSVVSCVENETNYVKGPYNFESAGTYTFRTDENHVFANGTTEQVVTILPRTITIEETNINTGMDIYSNSSVAFDNLLSGDFISVKGQLIANGEKFNNFATAGVYNFQLPNNNYVFEDELENYLIEVLPKKVTLNNGIEAQGYTAKDGVITIETRVDNIKVSASMDMYGVRFEDIVANNGAVLEDKFITNTSVTATVPMSSTLNEVSLIGAVKKVYTVTAVGGTASASQVDFADKVTLSAAIPSGKAFAGWKIGGNVVSYLPEYTFRVTSDIIAEAVFVDVAAEDIYTHIFLDLGGFEFKTIKNSIANMADTDEVVLANELALNFMGWKVKSNKDNTITYSPIYESDESVKVLVNNVETLYNQAIVLEGGKTYSVNGVAVAPTSDMTIYAVSDMTIEEVAATEQVAVTTRVDKVGTMNYISGTVVSAEAIESVSFDFAGSNYVMYIDKYVQTGNVRQFCVYVSDELLAKVFGQSGKISGNISVNGVVVGTEVKLREA